MDSPGDVVAGYRAILFLDLVESCALKARLGEQRFFDEIESPYLEIVQTALSRGASAYIAKTVNPADLPGALRQVIDGTVYHAFGMTDGGGHQEADLDLTERELTVLQALARGLSNKAIGNEFWVTEQTVKFHLGNLYRKLGVPNRLAAASYAHAHGVLDA